MEDEPISEVSAENLGPAMLALTPQQRRFVVGWIQVRGKSAARVARAAGYSDVKEGSKVRAWELMHNPKIMTALKEEADRRLDSAAVVAVLGLKDLLNSDDDKIRANAIDSVLDRTGYSRRTTQNIAVTHVDNRSTVELMADIRKLMGPLAVQSLPMIEGEIVDATEGA